MKLFIENINGNAIPFIEIGGQFWMTENLNVETFRNGDKITEAKNIEEWKMATHEKIPVWCYYNYEQKYASIFGKIYNGFAVVDPRGLAPEGWHVPSDLEWLNLSKVLGGENVAGFKMRIKMDECEKLNLPIEWAGSNRSGFSALPGSFSCSDGNFFDQGRIFSDAINIYTMYTSFWSSSWRDSKNGLHVSTPAIDISGHFGGEISGEFSDGRYVRCVKDNNL
ncbi:MAG: hypothetical protein RIT43_63 [Bacteroidota bacterium]